MLDLDMREPLFDYIEQFYGKIRVFEEKTTGRSRADVIGIIDGAFIGFEIKSDGDSYARLKTQTRDYDQLCDINYIVVGESHRRHASEHVPGHWGVLCVFEREDGIHVEMDQVPAINPQARLARQLGFLWRPELASLLEMNHMPKYAWESKAFVQQKLMEKVPPGLLKRQITDMLFERDYDLLLAEIERVKKARECARKERARAASKSKRRARKTASGIAAKAAKRPADKIAGKSAKRRTRQ